MARRHKRRVFFPVTMLAIGLVAGWWIARYGVPMLKEIQPPSATTSAATGNIRKADFMNFTYAPSCASTEAGLVDVTVRNGEYRLQEDFDQMFFNVLAVDYGDLTGDGQAEAVVLTNCNTGGTGQFSEGMVFGMRQHKPVLIGRVEGGDRAYGGIISLSIKNKRVVVQRYATDEDGPACCPKYIETSGLRWDGKQLVPDGAATRQMAPQQ